MNLSNYKEIKPHLFKRIVWYIINATIYRWFASGIFKSFRHTLLRMFGAKIGKDALVYASCKIYAPWNLIVGRACIGPDTTIYNKALITIGDDTVISQGATLCTASHDISSLMLPLVMAEINIQDNAWIASDAFIGMGVTIGEGAVVGARAAVFKSVEPWSVVGGNPAKFIKKRVLKDE